MEEFSIDSKGPKWPVMLLKKNVFLTLVDNYKPVLKK